MPEVESVSKTRASEGERLSGNESQEAVDEIEDQKVDADARTEEVSYTTTAIHVKSHYLIAFFASFKSVLTEPSCC